MNQVMIYAILSITGAGVESKPLIGYFTPEGIELCIKQEKDMNTITAKDRAGFRFVCEVRNSI